MLQRRGLPATLCLFLFIVTPLANGQGEGAPVAIASAQARDIVEVIQLNGSVSARRNAQLSVATAGLVSRLELDEGDQVKAGQVLLALDAELARQQYRAAMAAQTQASRALADARRRLAEAEELAPKQSIAETVVRDIAAEVAEDEAALDQARAEAGYREGLLDRHQLKAPFAGVITARQVELGEWIVPGDAAFTLVSTDQLRLDFQAPEDYQGKLQTGQPLEFSLGGRPGRHPATVSATVPASDAQSRTFLVRALPDRAVAGMLPGMSVRAEVRLPTGQRGITVPRDAVLRYADGRQIVWVVEREEGRTVASERRVRVGLAFDGEVEIRSGISAGDSVVIEGNEALRNGLAVAVTNG
ncbi:efflux RND transporter periplasmic adaptor subunit [Seongchinamella unica]|uniref:Efflux RND transporter periplasmic adaptor subunit n=1 Tax=Seongchinamella unica TaxID=2547392 RepID=A0A4R5LVI3_9GAMM|nr:efflux RND transporter periplasmic adaptor subunit [Seongchinamella unica]TDG15443.1 efflux RND transporter periplasmic adaptor subunit [Seongchinamella unica]